MLEYRNMKKVETNQFAEKRTRTKIFLVGSLVHLEKKQEKRECWKKWLSYYRMLNKKKDRLISWWQEINRKDKLPNAMHDN